MMIAGQALAMQNRSDLVGGERFRENFASVMLVLAMLTPAIEVVFRDSSIYQATILLNLGLVIAALVINRFKIPVLAFRVALPFLCLCAIGLLSAERKTSYYDILKDVWYVMNPCVAVIAGLVFGSVIKARRLIICTLIVGITFAVLHIIQFVSNPGEMNSSLRSLRQDAGLGEFTSALCLGILFALSWNKVPWRRISMPICFAVLPLCGLSQVLALTRIWWVCLIVICFSATGFLHPRRVHIWMAPLFLAVLLALSVPLLLPVSSLEQAGSSFQVQLNPFRTQTSSPSDRFLEKIQNSIHEITPRDFTNMTEIILNWRGYETYRGMLSFRQGSLNEMLFGRGFGSQTDVGVLIRLKGQIFRAIPWFHNGYVFLLIKTGVLGLLVYLAFIFMIIRYGMQGYNSNSKVTALVSRLLVGSALSLILGTAVFAGAFNRSRFVTALIFIGAALALQRHLLGRQAALSLHRRGSSVPRRLRILSAPSNGEASGLSTAATTQLTTVGHPQAG